MPELKILFLGMNGRFSAPPFRALVRAGLKPGALVLPPPRGMEVVFRRIRYPGTGHGVPDSRASLLALGARHGIPIYEIGKMTDERALALAARTGADLIVTACFPRLLPGAWLRTPRLGALNLHPSLLPAYRGPQPLFWQFRAGETATGVTLHFMDAGADSGDIVSHAEVPFPDGISEAQAEGLTGRKGAGLLIAALADPGHIPRRAQPQAGASRQPVPRPQDLVIPAGWTARRAFNFMRGAQAWGPFEVEQAGGWVRVNRAEVYVTGGIAGPFTGTEQPAGTWLKMSDGAVMVKLAES